MHDRRSGCSLIARPKNWKNCTLLSSKLINTLLISNAEFQVRAPICHYGLQFTLEIAVVDSTESHAVPELYLEVKPDAGWSIRIRALTETTLGHYKINFLPISIHQTGLLSAVG